MRMETYIRKCLGMKAHYVSGVTETGDELVAEVERYGGRRLQCGCCGTRVKRTKGRAKRPRSWRGLSMGGKWLVIRYWPMRVWCPTCGARTEGVPWSGRWSRLTRRLAEAVALMAKDRDWSATAAHFGLNWKTVVAVVKRAVKWGLAKRRLKPIRLVGVDEVSRKKGHHYLTLVYDLERGHLLWVGEGRTEETLDAFFAWLGKRRSRNLRVVCVDMWKAYLNAVQRHAAQATVAFDRFHVVRHVNAAVDEVRRALWQKLSGALRKAVKGTRFVLLKNPWNLTWKQKRRLSEVVRINSPLSRAYYLKEDFQRFWDYRYEGWAKQHMKQWLWWASHSRLEPFKRLARLVRDHLHGILVWTKLRVSNGALEGMNNKVKLVSHRAFGFRNVENFTMAIFHCCGNLPT
jgi:transposase